jgi:hypothetical protein
MKIKLKKDISNLKSKSNRCDCTDGIKTIIPIADILQCAKLLCKGKKNLILCYYFVFLTAILNDTDDPRRFSKAL